MATKVVTFTALVGMLASMLVSPVTVAASLAVPMSVRSTYIATGPYGPPDLRAAYNVPVSKTRATVALVVAYDAPNVEADLATYRKSYGIKPCTTANGCFHKVNQEGQASPLPQTNLLWADEATLDVDMVSAICPTCRILLVEANSAKGSGNETDLQNAVLTATTLGAHYVSMSWALPEESADSSYDAKYLSASNVTYVAAAGDSGFVTAWPASSPNVIAVGGTTLKRAPKTHRGWTERAWSYNAVRGTGSGCSRYAAKPRWQKARVTTCKTRAINDVSVIADTNPGVYVALGSNWFGFGGTSAGAPIVAAMEALAGARGNNLAYMYKHYRQFHDVTKGTTASCGTVLCRAHKGWDGPTGLGTPNGVAGLSPQRRVRK